MSLTIPWRWANGPGNVPDSNNLMDDYDWLTAIANGTGLITNGGQERWSLATTFTNPSNGATLSDGWTLLKSGSSPATVDVTREASIIQSGSFSMKANITGAGSSDSSWGITQSVSTPTRFNGQTILVTFWGYISNASKLRIKVTDGTNTAFSPYHPGGNVWKQMQAVLAFSNPSSACTVTVEINPSNATDAVYIDSIAAFVVPANMTTKAQGFLDYSTLQDVTALTDPSLTAPNILDNGGFEIWQRGSSFSAPGSLSYLSDRWFNVTDETAGVTVTKETTTIDSVGLASMKIVVTGAGAAHVWYIRQKIENVADYRGKTIACTIRVNSSVANAIKLEMFDSDVMDVRSAFASGSGTWQTLTVTGTVGAAATSLIVQVGMVQAGDKQNGTYYFDSAMLALGSVGIPFIGTNPAIDLARCQRYFQVLGGEVTIEPLFSGFCASSTQTIGPIRFIVPMRVAPTALVNNVTNFTVNCASTTPATTNVSVDQITTKGGRGVATVASGLTTGQYSYVATANTNASIYFSADL